MPAEALGHAGVKHPEFLAEAGAHASKHQRDFGTQEMLRFLGAFRRAGWERQMEMERFMVERVHIYIYISIYWKTTDVKLIVCQFVT